MLITASTNFLLKVCGKTSLKNPILKSLPRNMSTMAGEKSMWARNCDTDTAKPVEGTLEGTIPSWLDGRLVRNGPGQRHVGLDTYQHLFDGLAVLHMVHVTNGKATYTSRHLESNTYEVNSRANRIIVTEFGTVGVPDPCLSLYGRFSAWFQPGLKGISTDNCSVNVLQVKDQMLAMTETNDVRIINPETLDTLPDKLKYSRYVSVQRVTAHPHVDPNGIVYNLGFDSSGGPMKYCIVGLKDGKIENSKMEASVLSRWKLNPGYMHSFGITENYFILAETPMCFDVKKLMLPRLAKYSPFDAMVYHENEKTRFRIISRSTGEEIKRNFLVPPFFTFHFANCFESNGNVIIDLCKADGNLIKSLAMANIEKANSDPTKLAANVYPARYVLPVDGLDDLPVGEELLKNVSEAKISNGDILACASAIKQQNGDILAKELILSEKKMELPRINYNYNMKPYSYFYACAISDPETEKVNFDSLVKVEVKTGETKTFQDKEYYCSEPVFVSSPNGQEEDDGVVLSLLLHKSQVKNLSLLVLDAKNFTETARVDFVANGEVTSTFHGQFIATGDKSHSY